jgi:HPt (histidine-containing phosphotransfer) domain-containing protein
MQSNDAFDLEATLKRLDGDRGLFRELIDFFFEDSPVVIEQLKGGLQAGNLSIVERAAHSLKGLTANVGSGPANRLAARIEDSSRRKDLTVAAASLDELVTEMARLTTALKQFKAMPDPPSATFP